MRPIDNISTPSYLSNKRGRSRFIGPFASNLPEKCRIPESRKQYPAAAAW